MTQIIRLAIIDHATHQLYVEDVLNTEIEKCGGEEEYIKENYTLDGDFSWDYIAHADYFGLEDKTPTEIFFESYDE